MDNLLDRLQREHSPLGEFLAAIGLVALAVIVVVLYMIAFSGGAA